MEGLTCPAQPDGDQGPGNFLSHFFPVTFIWHPRRNQWRHILETSFSCRELSFSQYILEREKEGEEASERNTGVSCAVISTRSSSPSEHLYVPFVTSTWGFPRILAPKRSIHGFPLYVLNTSGCLP